MSSRRPDLDAPDDVDRLFARLETIEAPGDFVARVAQATYAAPVAAPQLRRGLWLTLDAAALLLLAALSVSFGMELQDAGALDLIALMVLDVGALRDGFGDLLAALVDSLPWLQIALLALNVAAIGLLSRRALDGTRPS